jgi:hypothetical protein
MVDDSKKTAEPAAPATPAADAPTLPEPILPKKLKRFKRLRGFITGKSRRERRAEKEAALKEFNEVTKKAAATTGGPGAKKAYVPPAPLLSTNDSFDLNDDQSTIYNVDVDDRSIVTRDTADTSGYGADQLLGSAASPGSTGSGPPTPVKKPYLLKVVLLLMDPTTRRFELLQLEFDSLKALVSDVLNQIPVSVTEESLRSQQYSGICGKSATLMASDQLLSTFCVGNDVLVAVPSSLTAKECTRLAKPILSDDKVLSMVRLVRVLEATFFDCYCLLLDPNSPCSVLPCIFCVAHVMWN